MWHKDCNRWYIQHHTISALKAETEGLSVVTDKAFVEMLRMYFYQDYLKVVELEGLKELLAIDEHGIITEDALAPLVQW